MGYRFDFYTDPGGRKQNEDAAAALEQDGCWLFLVADGLGGSGGGEIASALAAEELQRRFRAEGRRFDLEEAIRAADEGIKQAQRSLRGKMKSTIAAAFLTEEEAVLSHVGDSRLYLFSAGRPVYQSVDHSAAQMAVALGEITPEELRSHEDRHILTRALGGGESLRVETVRVPGGDYDALLLCSDGFWEYLTEAELARTVQPDPSAWLRDLRALHARRADAHCDNHTAVAVTREESEEKDVLQILHGRDRGAEPELSALRETVIPKPAGLPPSGGDGPEQQVSGGSGFGGRRLWHYLHRKR